MKKKRKKRRNQAESYINSKDTLGKYESNENQDLIAFASYIFDQVKLQQETRDKWMELYFAIFAGVATFATFALTFFSNKLKMEQLECIVGIVFILTGVIGMIFYLLFLCQRLNYKLHYKVLSEIQRKIVVQYLSKPYETYYQEVSDSVENVNWVTLYMRYDRYRKQILARPKEDGDEIPDLGEADAQAVADAFLQKLGYSEL